LYQLVVGTEVKPFLFLGGWAGQPCCIDSFHVVSIIVQKMVTFKVGKQNIYVHGYSIVWDKDLIRVGWYKGCLMVIVWCNMNDASCFNIKFCKFVKLSNYFKGVKGWPRVGVWSGLRKSYSGN